MQPKEYDILRRAVDDGLQTGFSQYQRSKDIDPATHAALSDPALIRGLHEAIVDEICQWFDFPESLLPIEEPNPE